MHSHHPRSTAPKAMHSHAIICRLSMCKKLVEQVMAGDFFAPRNSCWSWGGTETRPQLECQHPCRAAESQSHSRPRGQGWTRMDQEWPGHVWETPNLNYRTQSLRTCAFLWDIAAYFSYPDWWTPYNSMTRKHLESDSWWRRITLISDDARLYNPGAGAPCPLPLACSTRSTPFRALVSEYHAFICVPSPRSGRGSMWSDQRPNTFQHFEASECLETWKCRLANCKGFCFSVVCWKVFGPCFGQERRTLRNWVQNFIEHHKKLWKSAVWISLMMVMMMLIATIWDWGLAGEGGVQCKVSRGWRLQPCQYLANSRGTSASRS